MKTFKLSFLFLFFSILFFSCSENENQVSNVVEDSISKTIENGKYKVNDYKNENRKLLNSVTLNCVGNCDGGGRCALVIDFNNPDVAECSCAGCSLEITFEKNSIKTDRLDQSTYSTAFINYLIESQKFQSPRVLINNIYIDDYSDVRTVLYEYYTEKNTLKTAMLIQQKDENGNVSKVFNGGIVVDCSGGCNGEQTCRERYIISTGTVECTCEGSCVMTITEN